MARAGTLRDGVLTLELDAVSAAWPAGAGSTPGYPVEAFAERGKEPSLPGPLIRVPSGTVVRVSIRNTLTRPITLFLPTSAATDDSVRVEPGATGALQVRATQSGNFIYRATSTSKVSQEVRVAGAMAGAMIVDTAGATVVPRDRVMVILMTPDSTLAAEMDERVICWSRFRSRCREYCPQSRKNCCENSLNSITKT